MAKATDSVKVSAVEVTELTHDEQSDRNIQVYNNEQEKYFSGKKSKSSKVLTSNFNDLWISKVTN
ncbi:hypothetical protein A4S05_00040 [Nostoc sp. KVJ20]|uniref:hypothetical protein n=1 Tax=unclassified Nostoc TaxID=2593658 RepID=UPI00083D9516|nr:hypothetical protein [Nostoc sp. KVJ20]ODH00411.1 hypothetical protein A4S05_00040 [Nostoc sp. KVJ20]